MSYPESFDKEIINISSVNNIVTRFPPENNYHLHLVTSKKWNRILDMLRQKVENVF